MDCSRWCSNGTLIAGEAFPKTRPLEEAKKGSFIQEEEDEEAAINAFAGCAKMPRCFEISNILYKFVENVWQSLISKVKKYNKSSFKL